MITNASEQILLCSVESTPDAFEIIITEVQCDVCDMLSISTEQESGHTGTVRRVASSRCVEGSRTEPIRTGIGATLRQKCRACFHGKRIGSIRAMSDRVCDANQLPTISQADILSIQLSKRLRFE